jgi:hypothetical protein
MTDTTVGAASKSGNPIARLVALRWKHALVVFVVGTTTYALYELGGWTIDTAVFGIATLAILAYSIGTYRSDVR